MEEPTLRFGDQISADFKLSLTGPNQEKYQRNPVYLHSAILKRSNFFEIMLSERWSSGKLTEVSVTTPHPFDNYLKCIQLMYSERIYFSNVEECLNILSVASVLMADDSINKCMQYLEAVRWNGEQESQIRNMLSSLSLKVLPDLAARLESECHGDIASAQYSLIKQMVSLIQGHGATRNRENAEKYIAGILEKNTHPDTVKVCGLTLLQGFISSIRSRDFSAISLLFKYIQRCDGETLEKSFKAFCEDEEFMKYLLETKSYIQNGIPVRTYGIESHPLGREFVFSTIIWFVKAIGDGKIIISRISRSSFITTWLPIMTALSRIREAIKLDEFENAILIAMESLPNVDKIGIFNSWIKLYIKYQMDIDKPLTAFKALENAYYKSTSKQ